MGLRMHMPRRQARDFAGHEVIGRVLTELTEARKCKRYTEHIPGRCPEWHRDRYFELEAERRQRSWEFRQKLLWWLLGIVSATLGRVLIKIILGLISVPR